jgi:hypothetical protein
MTPRDSKILRATLAVLTTLIISFLISVRTDAQVVGATLSGTVTDASGAAIANVQIAVNDVVRAGTRTVTTDSDGFYTAPNLVPSTYQVTATAQGFATTTQSAITLTVGAKQVLNLVMTVGEVSQRVEVTTEAPTVELTSSSLTSVVSSQTVVELPLNGRDWTQLATLQPAVHLVTTQMPISANSNRSNRGFGSQLTISGTRPQLNNYRLDGVSIVDNAGGAPGSALGIALGVDAIAEFSVVTANHSAEYGRTSGGVINAITRSGTNKIHGDAYWFLRDEGVDARNFFDPAKIPPFHRNQFGASAGGPIQKDKTFFFVDYEGIRQDKSSPNANIVPSLDAHNGIVHNANGTTSAVDHLILPFLALYPLPNGPPTAGGNGNTAAFNDVVNNVNTGNFVTFRIDRKLSGKDSLSGTYFIDMGTVGQPDPFDYEVVGNTTKRQMIALEETHAFSPSLVNSLRAGFSRVGVFNNTITQILNPLLNDASFASIPGRFASQILIKGVTTFSGGAGGLSTGASVYNSFQGYDDAFVTRGVHSLKLGFAVERMQENQGTGGGASGGFYPNGQTQFGDIVGFLTNRPVTFSAAVIQTTPSTGSGKRQSLFGGYVQDDWRWRPNLTVNLGLRYEMVTVPTDTHNTLSLLLTLSSFPPHLGSPLYNNSTHRNFEPRVGFSWDPFHNGKTAVRAAFGIFDALPLLYESNTVDSNAPFGAAQTLGNLPQGSFPLGLTAGSVNTPTPTSKLRYGFMEQNPHRNYLMMWNLNIQHQLTPSTAVTIGYVGNHGVHMINRSDDMNLVLPTVTAQGLLWPSPAGSGTKINPNVGDVRGDFWSGDAEYDALEVLVMKRLSHGFQAQGSYTWSKNIDTGSASVLGDPFSNSISSLFWFCNSCRRGLSDYNVAHNLTVNYIWDLPTPKNWGAIGSHLLGGWEVGGIISAQTGVPITPLIGGDPLGLNSTDPYAFPNRNYSAPGCKTAVNPGNVSGYINLSCFSVPNPLTLMGNSGRNTIIGPGILTWDSSLFKNNYIRRISETFNVQFRAEMFNLLNRANFSTPFDNETLFSATGAPIGNAGALDQTSTTAREIQFALKLIW